MLALVVLVVAVTVTQCSCLPVPVDDNRTRTIIEFSRLLNTCDDRDNVINDGTTNVVWATATRTPFSELSIGFHGDTKGSKALRLLSKAAPSEIPSDASTFSLTFNNRSIPFDDKITGNKTTYFCKTFAVPIPNVEYLIRAEPIVTPGLYGRVHHMLAYVCNDMPASLLGFEGHCYSDSTPDVLKQCNGGTVMSAWAIGGTAFNYPPEAALPIGGSVIKYILLEVHYDNPNEIPIVDSSGMLYTFTPTARKYDAGILTLGYMTDPALTVPALTESTVFTSYCPSECTKRFTTPITVVSTQLHAHTSAVAIKLRQVRDGIELPPILTDKHYDFNFQDYETFASPHTVLPGDQLMVQCEYNTLSRNDVTHFGLTTTQEMCLAYSVYYPALPASMSVCLYDNVTDDTDPSVNVEYAYCDNASVKAPSILHVNSDSFTPFVDNCTYVAPDARSQIPVLSKTGFNVLDYSNSAVLSDDDDSVTLHWRSNETHITLAIDVDQTTGWFGLGFSGTGEMIGSDVSIGYVDVNGTLFHKDRFADAQARPPIDDKQDYADITFYTNYVQTSN